MVNFYIFLKDYSGSAKKDQRYHGDHTKELVKRFKSDIEKIQESAKEDAESKIIYITWETYCYTVKEEEIYSENSGWKLNGMGGRLEEAISLIQKIFGQPEKNTIKLLYLMTKNKISRVNIATSFAMNEGINYENFVFHAFNDDESPIDLSIASSFLKKRCAIYKNLQLIDDVDISKEFDYDKIKVNNFLIEKDQLQSYIKLKFINKFKHYTVVLKELNKLKKLRSRLSVESQQRIGLRGEIFKVMTALINYVASEENDYSFNALKIQVELDGSVNETEEELEEDMEVDPVLEDNSEDRNMIRKKFDLVENLIFQRAKKLVQV
ncbi:uncharacterized protein LOC133533983 [Cydia pomonella]|uniref:uncharacterized protein LOC133533983 n=1 Tax=Cydia pomonella TaxID=82600 RepID=UPI002ADDF269|nr:uncharacterized protein LOC133533983 [Cydia pomonella]